MLFDINFKSGIAFEDCEGRTLSYDALSMLCQNMSDIDLPRGIAFILSDNNIESIALFISLINSKVVPLLLSKDLDEDLLKSYFTIYKPLYIVAPKYKFIEFSDEKILDFLDYSLMYTKFQRYHINESLAFLLSTSGTTGSPKLVRHSYINLIESARNVAKALNLTHEERAMATLPMFFTQGLNVILSNIFAGGTVLLNNKSLMSKEFWNFLLNSDVTSITGVPYSYEIMIRLGLLRKEIPTLKILNQGGGRLSDITYQKIAIYAKDNGKKFIPTYGSTETTSRMCYLDPELSYIKIGSIGKPIPSGKVELVDDNGTIIQKENTIGEIVYYGPNVTMGYATSIDDLLLGDERKGKYYTGDMAYFDADGCLFIVGRKGRFVKIFGYRVSLDEVEKLLTAEFGREFACSGDDRCIKIYHEQNINDDEIIDYISIKIGIIRSAFKSIRIDKIPRNDYGKILYKLL